MDEIRQAMRRVGLALGVLASVAVLAGGQTGRVAGGVYDAQGAVVAGGTVVMRRADRSVAARGAVDGRGEYAVELPAGVYLPSLEGNREMVAHRRAPFRVEAGKSYRLNLYPVFRAGVALTLEGDRRLGGAGVAYEETPAEEGLWAEIRFSWKQNRTGETEYGGAGTALTHEFVTVTSRSLRVDAARAVVRGDERVVVDSGGTRVEGDAFTVWLRERRVEVRKGGRNEELRYGGSAALVADWGRPTLADQMGLDPCSSERRNRQVVERVAAAGPAALPALEEALQSIESGKAGSAYFLHARWVALAYARIRGREAVARLGALQAASGLSRAQLGLDEAYAAAMGLRPERKAGGGIWRRISCDGGE